MAIDKIELRILIRYCWKRGLSTRKAADEICSVEGEGTVAYAAISKWYKRFNSGEMSLEDKPRSGRPSKPDVVEEWLLSLASGYELLEQPNMDENYSTKNEESDDSNDENGLPTKKFKNGSDQEIKNEFTEGAVLENFIENEQLENSCSDEEEYGPHPTDLLNLEYDLEPESDELNLITYDNPKLYHCDKCDYTGTRKDYLVRHSETHNEKKIFSCDLCDYEGKTNASLYMHKKRHSGEKPYKCLECQREFLRKGDLNRHFRVHTGEKPYECDICSYRSSRCDEMVSHKRIHLYEKPFKCPLCDFRYSRKNELNRHFRKHTGEKPYACDLCPYRSARRDGLNSHQKIHLR